MMFVCPAYIHLLLMYLSKDACKPSCRPSTPRIPSETGARSARRDAAELSRPACRKKRVPRTEVARTQPGFPVVRPYQPSLSPWTRLDRVHESHVHTPSLAVTPAVAPTPHRPKSHGHRTRLASSNHSRPSQKVTASRSSSCCRPGWLPVLRPRWPSSRAAQKTPTAVRPCRAPCHPQPETTSPRPSRPPPRPSRPNVRTTSFSPFSTTTASSARPPTGSTTEAHPPG